MRKRIENKFSGLAGWIYDNHFKTLLFTLAFAGAFLFNLPKVVMDSSTEGFLHDDDPVLIAYNEFRDQFAGGLMIVVAIEPADLFDLDFLRKLKEFHEEIEDTVPYIDDINSLVNARNTRGEGDELIVEDLMETMPANETELAEFKQRVMTNPFYRNLLVSEDGAFTVIVIDLETYSPTEEAEDILEGFDEDETEQEDIPEQQFLTDSEQNEAIIAIREVMDRYNGPGFSVRMAGSPVVANDLKRAMQTNMKRFIILVAVIISIALFLVFRRISGVIYPLVVVGLSLLSTIGLMAFFGFAIKLPTTILPSFILAVGVGDSVHILALFYKRFSQNGDKRAAIVYAVGHSGLAILMTSLTTAAGLLSFAWAEVAPIADLGRFAAAGVILALIYTMIILPILIAVFPIKDKHNGGEAERNTMLDNILVSIADFSTAYPKSILVVSAVLVAGSLYLASGIRFSHNPLRWFHESENIRQTTELLDEKLKGTSSVEVILDTGKENGVQDVELLKKMEILANEMEFFREGDFFVGKTLALNDIVKETNQALHENRKEFYTIPEERNLVAQELLLFENSGSDDLENFVDTQFSKARITMKVPWLDSYFYGQFLKWFDADLAKRFDGLAEVTLTGMSPMFGRTLAAAISSATKSYIIAGIVITIMMILLIGNLKIGLLSMIPNLTPILLMLGIMGIMDYPLDMFTMLIGSIAIGLAVDDTVHFMHNYRRYLGETSDVRESVRRTLLTAGRAMLVTTVVLSLGFFIFMFATMSNLFNFGLLTGITIIAALLSDFFLAPAIMTLVGVPKNESN